MRPGIVDSMTYMDEDEKSAPYIKSLDAREMLCCKERILPARTCLGSFGKCYPGRGECSTQTGRHRFMTMTIHCASPFLIGQGNPTARLISPLHLPSQSGGIRCTVRQ